MASVRRRTAPRSGLPWVLITAAIFGYVLCLTYERIELKERNGRIEGLERVLQESRSDESFLRVTIERECNYAEVHRLAREKWGMDVAHRNQRILLAADERPVANRDNGMPQIQKAGLITVAERVTRLFRENVALARPTPEGRDGATAR